VYWTKKHSEELGGPRHTVEIDKVKIDQRKHNRARILEGNWIFGGIERESKKILLIQNRIQETLLNCIKE